MLAVLFKRVSMERVDGVYGVAQAAHPEFFVKNLKLRPHNFSRTRIRHHQVFVGHNRRCESYSSFGLLSIVERKLSQSDFFAIIR